MATQAVPQPTGQDPVRVDARHYTVELEDEKVRVLRIRYGPGEKSVMHGHPDLVGIMLTNSTIRMTYPDGTTEDVITTAGQVMRMPAIEHLPENVSGHVFEAILIELKS